MTKVAIVYFSQSGNTKEAAQYLKNKIKENKHEAELIEIQGKKKFGYLSGGRAGLKQEPLPIKNTKFDIKKYDSIIVGMPKWAGKPAPYYKSFFDIAENIKGKKTGLFITQGGNDKNTILDTCVKEYFFAKDIDFVDTCLRFRMRKGEILEGGTQNTDEFVKKVL